MSHGSSLLDPLLRLHGWISNPDFVESVGAGQKGWWTWKIKAMVWSIRRLHEPPIVLKSAAVDMSKQVSHVIVADPETG